MVIKPCRNWIAHVLGNSARAVVALSLATILVMVFATTLLVLDLQQTQLRHAQGEIRSLGRVLSEQTSRIFDGIELTMRSGRDRLSDDIGSQLPLDSLPVHLLLQARSGGLPQVKSIFLINEQGFGVNSSRPDFIHSLDMRQREFFNYFANGGSGELFISKPEKAGVDHGWAIYVSMPVRRADNSLRAVLVTVINIDYLANIYSSSGFETVSHVALLNAQGIHLAGASGRGNVPGQREGNQSTLDLLLGANAPHEWEGIENETDGMSFVAYHAVAQYPLVVRVTTQKDHALAPWYRVLRPIMLGLLLIIGCVIAFTWLMQRHLRRKALLDDMLKKHDAQLRNMVQSVSDAFITVDAGKRIILFNDAAACMFGVPVQEAIRLTLDELFAKCMQPQQCLYLLAYVEEKWDTRAAPSLLGILELQREEQEFPVELSLSRTGHGDEILHTLVFHDLSERRRAERELLETNRQLQELSASQHQVREEERTRIARELHDELGQSLTGIRMQVSWIGKHLSAEQQPLVEKVDLIKTFIDQTIAGVRRISSELRPLVLDDLGFAAAASWWVNQFSTSTGIPVTLDLPANSLEESSDVATALFRILQESLTNVARHAQASQASVQLRQVDDTWELRIEDNGLGFTQAGGRPAGLGLVGIRERAHILDGLLTITSTPGSGTLIVVSIPAEKWQQTRSLIQNPG